MDNIIPRSWWKEAVVYQVYPRSFMDTNGDGIGDIKGVTEKMSYLKNLGIDVIWLSPIFKSPNKDNGYDISDYKDIMDDFGTMEDFDEMLSVAHDAGIKIVMDLVVNHSSNEHPWFIESRKIDSEFRDYYIWKEGKDNKPPNNWGGVFGGSVWDYDEKSGQYYLHLFTPEQPDLNWENKAVRDSVHDIMRFWLDKGIDGFRMDVINCISKPEDLSDGEVGPTGYGNFFPLSSNRDRVHDFLKEMNDEVLSKYDVMTVGETPAATIDDAIKYAGFDSGELNMVFQFEHMELDGGPLGKWSDNRFKLVDLKKTLAKWQNGLYGKAWNSLYWNNHDQPRVVSRFGNDKEYRVVSAKMLALCLHMMQGTPYIYQGEELGMTNVKFSSIDDYKDVEIINAYRELTEGGHVTPEDMMRFIHKSGRDNARTPIQWDSSKNAGFSKGEPWIGINPNYKEINAEAQIGDENSVFNFYKKLISIRKKHDIIVYGDFKLINEDDNDVFAYKRILGDEKLLVVCNFTEKPIKFTIEEDLIFGEIYISNYNDTFTYDKTTDGKNTNIDLRPFEAFSIKIK